MFIKKLRMICAIALSLILITSTAIPALAIDSVKIKTSNQVSSDVPYIVNSKEKAIWLDGCTIDGVNTIDAVKWIYEEGTYYFFMPTTADLSNVRVYTNFNNVEFNSTQAINNQDLDLTGVNKKGIIKADGKNYKYEIMQSSKVGTIFLTTETGSMDLVNQSKDKSHKEPGEILVIDENKTINYDNLLDFIKGRGNTTWQKDKKPYNIKLEEKAGLMGMAESKKWCLLANAQEHSSLRNKFAYDMAYEMGLEISSESHFTDVYANGEYLGTYQITEKVELGDNNLVNISELEKNTEDACKDAGRNDDLESYRPYSYGFEGYKGYRQAKKIPNNPEDITGGYLIELVYGLGEISGFITTRNQNVDLKSPECASVNQINYIADLYQDMENALFSKTGYNNKGKHYTEYIDIEDAVKMYLLHEFVMNIDTGISSCFLYKDSDVTGDGKFHLSPAWDFDVSLGNIDRTKDGVHLLDYNQMYANKTMLSNTQGTKTIFGALCTHDDFNELCVKVWNEDFVPAYKVFTGENESTKRLQSIDEYRNMLNDTLTMNYTLWDLTTNLLVPSIGTTFTEHIDYLENWTNGRFAYLSNVFTSLEEAKKFAIDEINNVFNSYNESDYSKEEYNQLISVKDNGIKSVNQAKTSREVINAKENAIQNMKEIAGFRVKFDNTELGWEKIYAYWWNSSTSCKWPGVEVNLSSDNLTGTVEIPTDIEYIIFSNGKKEGAGKEQTINLKVPSTTKIFIPDLNSKTYDADKKAYCYDGEWQELGKNAGVGDVNLDGKINVADVFTLQMYLSNYKTLSGQAKINADYNKDGKINIRDAVDLQMKIALYI